MGISGRSTGNCFLWASRIINRIKSKSNSIVDASLVHVLSRERTEQSRRRLGHGQDRSRGCRPTVPNRRPTQVPSGQGLGQPNAGRVLFVLDGQRLGIVDRLWSLMVVGKLSTADFDMVARMTVSRNIVFTGICWSASNDITVCGTNKG